MIVFAALSEIDVAFRQRSFCVATVGFVIRWNDCIRQADRTGKFAQLDRFIYGTRACADHAAAILHGVITIFFESGESLIGEIDDVFRLRTFGVFQNRRGEHIRLGTCMISRRQRYRDRGNQAGGDGQNHHKLMPLFHLNLSFRKCALDRAMHFGRRASKRLMQFRKLLHRSSPPSKSARSALRARYRRAVTRFSGRHSIFATSRME